MNPMRKRGMKIIWFSLIVNSILFVIKYYAGYESDSIAMIADAWHTLSDSLSTVIVLLGFWIADKPADKEHPFGHGRSESIASIVLATMLAMIGLENLIESSSRLYSQELPNYSSTAIIIFSISIVFKEVMAQFSIREGKKIGSKALIADGWHHRSDAITTIIIVLVAIFGSTLSWADGTMGIVVSLLLFYVAYEILKASINSIMGTQPGYSLQKDIIQIAKDVNPAITSLHHFKIHEYGDHKEMSFDIRLPAEMTVQSAHAIANTLEQSILYRLKIKATVHIEPGLSSSDFKTGTHY